MKQVSPSINKTAFDCPHCRAFSEQSWYSLGALPTNIINRVPIEEYKNFPENLENEPTIKGNIIAGFPTLSPTYTTLHPRHPIESYNAFVSSCSHCKKLSIWVRGELIYPQSSSAPPVNSDLPDDIREDYDEASNILNLSPRGSAALLRLAIQKLCKKLGQKGKYINEDIAALVSEGLSTHIQQALDTVRVIGNDAVHPGQIDLRDDEETARSLFAFVNLIADKMISEPKRIEEAYKGLPESKLEAIKERDNN